MVKPSERIIELADEAFRKDVFKSPHDAGPSIQHFLAAILSYLDEEAAKVNK